MIAKYNNNTYIANLRDAHDCDGFIVEKEYIKQDGKIITKTEEMQVEPDEFKHMMVQLRIVNF